MTDTIVLTIPTEQRYLGVATLVLGGVGTRLDLPYDRTDELQLAVLSVLDAGKGEDVSLRIDSDDGGVMVSIGPVADGSGSDAALTRVLSRLVDDVSTERRDGEEWLTLRLSSPR